MSAVVAFRLDDGAIVQSSSGNEHRFKPEDFGLFTRGSLVVRACRIPVPFRVGPEICKNGYLVYDGRLKAISSSTFTLDYQPLAEKVDPKSPEDAEPGEWETAA